MSGIIAIFFASCLSAPISDMDLKPLGEATYKKAMFKLYDASLCVPEQKDVFDMDAPFALALDYKRDFSSQQITGAGIHEMARFARKDKTEFSALEPLFLKCFPDVEKGDQIIAVSDGPTKARFYYNGQQSCSVDYPEFRHLFFGIWLGEETRVPKKAALLKGEALP